VIVLNVNEFEKVAGVVSLAIKSVFGDVAEDVVSDRIKTKAREKAVSVGGEKRPHYTDRSMTHLKKVKSRKTKPMTKLSKLNDRPKVDTAGISRAKDTSLKDPESHSLRRAIERSTNQKDVLTEVKSSTEPIYAGGNTASNIRGVARAQEKAFRERAKKRFGKHSRIRKDRIY
jgi:hypothetical protein